MNNLSLAFEKYTQAVLDTDFPNLNIEDVLNSPLRDYFQWHVEAGLRNALESLEKFKLLGHADSGFNFSIDSYADNAAELTTLPFKALSDQSKDIDLVIELSHPDQPFAAVAYFNPSNPSKITGCAKYLNASAQVPRQVGYYEDVLDSALLKNELDFMKYLWERMLPLSTVWQVPLSNELCYYWNEDMDLSHDFEGFKTAYMELINSTSTVIEQVGIYYRDEVERKEVYFRINSSSMDKIDVIIYDINNYNDLIEKATCCMDCDPEIFTSEKTLARFMQQCL